MNKPLNLTYPTRLLSAVAAAATVLVSQAALAEAALFGAFWRD